MIFHKRQRPPTTLLEQSELSLNAATVMRDVSFLRSNGGVRDGCRLAMRQHALQWRSSCLLIWPPVG